MSENEIRRCRCSKIPLISIIIPAYNTEKYLGECVDSLLGQITDDVEIIIVNDGSCDSTLSICDEYYRSCDHICVIHHRSNMGLGVTRNTGIDLARGKYVWFIDSDDYVADNAISIIKDNLSDELEMFLFAATPFSDGAEILTTYERTVDLNIVMTGSDFLSDCLKANEYHSPVWLCVYKMSFLNKHNIRFDPVRIHEDEQFTFVSYLNACFVKAVNEHLVFRRYRQGSIMMNARANNERNFLNACYGYGNAIETASKAYDDLSDVDQKRELIIDMMSFWFLIVYSRYMELCYNDRKRCWPGLNELCMKMKRYKRHLPGKVKKRAVAPRLYGFYRICKRKLMNIGRTFIDKIYGIMLWMNLC